MSLDKLKIEVAPLTFATVVAAHNALVEVISKMQGRGGIKITVTEGNIIIEGGADGSGGVPAGYEEVEIDVCDLGPTIFLVKS